MLTQENINLRGSVEVFAFQNAKRPDMLTLWRADKGNPANQVIDYARQILGEEVIEDWTRPVTLVVALAAVSTALSWGLRGYRQIESFAIKPEITMGHSIGENLALWRQGGLGLEILFRLCNMRDMVCDTTRSAEEREKLGMAALVGVTPDLVRDKLAEAQIEGVDLANINTKTQVVLSGFKNSIEKFFKEYIEDPTAIGKRPRMVPLQVNMCHHSFVASPESKVFEEYVNSQGKDFHNPEGKILSPMCFQNGEDGLIDNAEKARTVISQQLVRQVNFLKACEELRAITTPRIIYAIDPSHSLESMVRANIGSECPILTVSNPDNLRLATIAAHGAYPQELAHLKGV